MAFTAKDVAQLRERTGCGMMDCKKALTEANGDMDAACSEALKQIEEKTYVDKKAIEEKKSSIDSADVTKYGDVALKLADKNGKGWNAVLLSEIIDAKFYIPQYILDAIAFAAREELKNVNYIHTILEYYGKVFSDVSIIEGLNTSEKIDYKEMVKDAKEQNTSSIRFLNTWLGVNG